MLLYTAKRLLLMIPTLFGIMVINFVIIQAAPGGPIEQTLSKIKGAASATERVSGGGQENLGQSRDGAGPTTGQGGGGLYRGARGLDPAFIKQLERQYGFDKPPVERFTDMMRRYLVFDFGQSFFRSQRVIDLVRDKLPVSISLGLWSTLLTYLISIPLGIAKAVRNGSRFDIWSSSIVIVAYAVPGFLFGILLIVLFSGGSFLQLFPLRGLTSDDWLQLSWPARILDYLWHITLPVTALTIGGFASLTMLTKNSFLDEIGKQYVITARAKGLAERRILYGHVFRNAMLLVVAGFPAAFIGILFTSSLLIEVIFSLDGLGLLGFEAALNRDYPIMFGSLYVFTLLGLVLNLAGDLLYTAVDPRIDFAVRRN